jgi:hypothetical protein
MKNQRFSWGMQKVTTPTWWCVKRFFGFWTGVHKLSALAWWGPYGFLEEIKANRITWKTSVFHGVCKKLQAQLDGVRSDFSVFGPFLVRWAQVKCSRSMGTLWLSRGDKNKQNHMKNQRF